jgi:adenosylcobinamide kinase/adenosylcobinamide-phosphate guanylyltransferase
MPVSQYSNTDIHLVLGGARSGKSRYAETLAEQSALPVVYVATAQALDQEMQSRIKQHQDQRNKTWRTIEGHNDLAAVIRELPSERHCILVDCLTLWVSGFLCSDEVFQPYKESLLAALRTTEHQIILVSNETGMGIIPMGELTRRFVDEIGFLHQEIASVASKVTLMMAGIPMRVKGAHDHE